MQNQAKKVLILVVVLLAVVAINLRRCSQGREAEFQLTEAQLLDQLDDRLPFRMAARSRIQVEFDHPRVSLAEGSDRVMLELQVALKNAKLSLSGSMNVSGSVGFAIMSGELHLADPVIEQLDVQGLPDGQRERVEDALTEALTAYFADRPIHTVTRADIPRLAAGTGVQGVKVKGQELAIHLGD